MNQKITAEMIDLLYATPIKVKPKRTELLLADLCTVNEVLQMAQRAKAAQLCQGKTYTPGYLDGYFLRHPRGYPAASGTAGADTENL